MDFEILVFSEIFNDSPGHNLGLNWSDSAPKCVSDHNQASPFVPSHKYFLDLWIKNLEPGVFLSNKYDFAERAFWFDMFLFEWMGDWENRDWNPLVLRRFAESLVTDGMTICLMTWYSGRLG